MATVPGLYTTVKNTSGATAVFGFLGLHGKRLNDDETFTVPGDLVAKLGGQRSQRQFKALEAALANGDLVIVNSPAVYITDSDDGSIDQIEVDDGNVETRSPQGWDN
jgi:hypothetical protein